MSEPTKIGAGILLCCEREALVLLRNSKHNHNTWGLPGGNADEEDGKDLFRTAQREAKEEMTVLPNFEVLGEVLTARGKKGQKHYTVFVCKMTPAERAQYKPELNEEHSQWRWFDIDELRSREDLHPVVRLMLHEHWGQLQALLA